MEGAALRRTHEFNVAIATGWHAALFALKGYAGKLRGQLSDYLIESDETQPRERNQHARAIFYFHQLKAKGYDVKIEKVTVN